MFRVPPSRRGCNQLLRDGAALIERVEDVFAALGWSASLPAQHSRHDEYAGALATNTSDPDRAKLLAAVDAVPVSLDALAQFVGLPRDRLQTTMLQLELEGLVRATARGYIRAS